MKTLGVFRDSESPSAAFTLRNAGDGPLRITGIRKTCGCAGAEADRESVEPGGAATVRVTVEPYTLEGAFSKSVFVLTDAAGAQPLRLTVTGECAPLFSVRPARTVDAGRLPSGAGWEGAFEVEAAEPAVLGAPAVTSDCPAAVSVEALSGARWRVPVKLSTPEHGAFRCRIAVPVLSPVGRPPLALEVAGRAGAELFAVPPVLIIPPSDGPVTRTVRVRLSGPRGRTLSPGQLRTTPDLEGLSVRAEAESGGGLSVGVTVSPDLSRRLAGDGPVKLRFAIPDAAPAEWTIKPSADSARHP
jgi:hypothetical protein